MIKREGGHEVGLELEWTVAGGVVLVAKDRSFVLELSREMTRELRNALVERLGI